MDMLCQNDKVDKQGKMGKTLYIRLLFMFKPSKAVDLYELKGIFQAKSSN